MRNPYENHHELEIDDGKEYGYEAQKVLVENDGTVLFRFPREMSDDHIWKVASGLSMVWRTGFNSGQRDIRYQLRRLIGA